MSVARNQILGPSGPESFYIRLPKALPWAILFRPVRASDETFTSHDHPEKQVNAYFIS